MARGFESKSVADQQESALDQPRRIEPGDPGVVNKKRRLELARADVQHRLESARADGHREMLRRALDAIEQELRGINT
jgi:hypothetical protein